MPEDKSAVDEFLQGLNKAPEDPFKSSDPFAPKEEEKEVVREEDSAEDKPLPFHKDPKVQRYVEKQITKALEGVRPSQAAPAVATEDEITDVLTRIIGNDTPEKQQGVKDLRRVLGSLEDKGAQRALEQLQAQAAEQVAEDKKAQEELDSSFEEIEEAYGVDLSSNTPLARKTRSDFVDYIRKIAPKNEDGEVAAFPDLPSAFEEFQERAKRSAPASRAKELASRSMSRSSDTSTAPVQGGKSWKDIDRLFNKLTN